MREPSEPLSLAELEQLRKNGQPFTRRIVATFDALGMSLAQALQSEHDVRQAWGAEKARLEARIAELEDVMRTAARKIDGCRCIAGEYDCALHELLGELPP